VIGTFYHTIDAKGRLFIPARLRDELGEVFFVTISTEKCLMVYSKERWDRAIQRLEAMPQAKQLKLRQLFSKASKCELDGQGRIQLPQQLRDFADLCKNITIVGTGVYVQIWDTETYKQIEEEEASPLNLKKAIEELDF